MDLPERLRLCGMTWACRASSARHKKGTLGLTSYSDLKITIFPAEKQVKREVLLHEVLHAIFVASGALVFFEEHEEEIVSILSPPLLVALRENPELVAFLLEEE